MRLGHVLEAELTGLVAEFSVQFGVKRGPGITPPPHPEVELK